jgi:hypothetical protein
MVRHMRHLGADKNMKKPRHFLDFLVRLRVWYAGVRGHKGKRWDYEPSKWYMGRHKGK